MTWLAVAYSVHGLLFRDGFACGFGSRKLELVDRLDDASSILEKARILLRNLPEWMIPNGMVLARDMGYCKIRNPINGATITGEGGDEIGRGGRTSIYFIDESAFLEHPHRVEASLLANTDCRIDISTHNGPGTVFYQKRMSGAVEVFIMDWRDDPRKDDAWYAKKCAEIDDPVIIAQEIDRDATASVEGICIPAAWVRAAVNLKLTPSAETVAGLDIAEYGQDRNVIIGRRGPVVLMPVDWGKVNTNETAWKAADEAERISAKLLNYDCIGIGAGVRGAYESNAERKLTFEPHALNSGESPSENVWPDGVTSKERFLNKRAELWWIARVRFEKTYEHVMGLAVHKPEEMISIPNHHQLITELSLPLYHRTTTGKTKIEAKEDMRKRGVKSPNFADALIYSLESPPSVFVPVAMAGKARRA